MNKKNQKAITLSILVATVLLLSVGFAAFSNSLSIKTKLSVSPNASDFRVVFSTSDSKEVTNNVIPTKYPTTITANEGKIDNSITPTISNISATFTSPGQKVVYNLYAYNAGGYEAYLNSVTLKGNKSCTPGEGTSIQMAGQACEAITIKVKVGNDIYNETTTGITGRSIGIGKSTPIEITLSYETDGALADGPFSVEFSDISLFYVTIPGQDEEYTGESEILYTGEIYRNSLQNLFIGSHIKNNNWCAVVPGVANSCVRNDYVNMGFNSEEECELTIQQFASDPTYAELAANAICELSTEPFNYEYETDLSNISQSYYLKHEVVNNVVTASYACITYTENGVRKDVCLRGGDGGAYYASNQAILRSVEPYFNTLDNNNSSTNYKGYCDFIGSLSSCYSDSFYLYAGSGGHVDAYDGSLHCDVSSYGDSRCY